MFNNVIYFLIAIFIYSVSHPGGAPQYSLPLSVTVFLLTWAVLGGYSYLAFRKVLRQLEKGTLGESRFTAKYQELITWLSILALFLFAIDVYLLNIRYWVQLIPGFDQVYFLQALIGISLFFLYLCMIWYFAYPAYKKVFGPALDRFSFIASHIRLNIPILFPWIVLTVVYDLVTFFPWPGANAFFRSLEGQIVFLSVFLCVLVIFMPRFIQFWWQCEPLESSEKASKLRSFLQEKGFRYRGFLKWPLFEGRMMTAGVMGIVPRYRYILITDYLLNALSVDELKAVLAHEMGHVRHRHLLFYMLFFIGYVILAYGLFDVTYYFLLASPVLERLITGDGPQAQTLFYSVFSIPMLIFILIYFRYGVGFFMRNFERQADFYSARTMGTPAPIIRSLEKIALFSGKSRDIPSWHHFSIRERVERLLDTIRDPGLIKRHNRFVAVSLSAFVLLIAALGYTLNFSEVKQDFTYGLVQGVLERKLKENPDNAELCERLAMIYQERQEYSRSIETYERSLEIDPHRSVSLNNLAWLLLTAPREELRDEKRALGLAERAVAMESKPVFLDTLAEAYYANGFRKKAVNTIKQALSKATENREYYESQLKKFSLSLPTKNQPR